MEDILGQGKEATALYTVSSNILLDSDSNNKKESIESLQYHQKREKENDSNFASQRESPPLVKSRPSTSAIQHESPSLLKRRRPGHGTGSHVARIKTELQTVVRLYENKQNSRRGTN